MGKQSSMNRMRVSTKAIGRSGKEKAVYFAAATALMIAIANEQIRLALLNW